MSNTKYTRHERLKAYHMNRRGVSTKVIAKQLAIPLGSVGHLVAMGKRLVQPESTPTRTAPVRALRDAAIKHLAKRHSMKLQAMTDSELAQAMGGAQ